MRKENDEVIAKVWITKYALTDGVKVAFNATVESEISASLLSVPSKGGMNGTFLVHKPHWHQTEAETMARLEKMVLAKLKSVEKQKAKLEALLVQSRTELKTTPWKQD